MTPATIPFPLRRPFRLGGVCLLAATLAVMPGILPFAPSGTGAAFAKSGNGGGNGNGNGGGNGNGHAGGKGGTGAAGKGKAAGKSAAARSASLATDEATDTPLSPSELGKWNAAKANQAALDAHIRNLNFNGTIGALAQYDLAAKAAAGEPLSEAEKAALDSLLGSGATTTSDEDLAAALNAGALAGDPVYSVDGGVVSCSANCDAADLAAAQAKADALAAEEQQTALDGLLAQSEQRILDESNKPVPDERADALLDHVAEQLGVTRPTDDPVTLTP